MQNNQLKDRGGGLAVGNRDETQESLQPPAISLPKGGGAIRGMGEKFAANPVTGTGFLTIPIASSPGRSGFGPQLSLAYDSGSGNGPFGFGWSLSIPSITRKTDKGLPKYRDAEESDVFILSGAEDFVPHLVEIGGHLQRHSDDRVVDGVNYMVLRYRPRIEGLFARIERWTNVDTSETHWRSISRDNITTLYGKTTESRIADPADPTRVFSWLICESYDDKGNAILYEYQAEDSAGVDRSQAHEKNRSDLSNSSNRHLKRIKYGNRTPNRDADWRATDPTLLNDWMFEAVFDYDEGHFQPLPADPAGREFALAVKDPLQTWPVRQDPFSSYRAGFEVRTYRLCRRVLMFHHFPEELGTHDCLVGSTEFAYRQSPIAGFITSATQSGYIHQPDTTQSNRYLKKSLPPLEFEYSQADIDETVREIDPESLENLPYGLDGSSYQWVDLDGEGISGILTEQADGWFYKRNLSPAHQVREGSVERTTVRLAPVELVAAKPVAALAAGQAQFMDLAGDGQADLVQFDAPVRGFYERTPDADWVTFRPFTSWPNLDTRDPNLKFIDLNGDGHTDILVTEDEVFRWHASLAEDGFGPARLVHQHDDEEKGPRLVFADGSQSIYLADLSGDGLTDLIRIRNGEMCYWPNLGYGRFGAKVAMDRSPVFDHADQFDQRRVRLGDIDGSGTTDIIYLGRNGITIWRNQSGNSWSDPEHLSVLPPTDNISSVTVVDLLGNGTACLVWSSPLPGHAGRQMRYINLMGGQKPHLLIRSVNNLGAETHVHYAPSTKFYLQDKLAGKPWITRLPFPVHVVERVETFDHISRNRFVTRYAYHHGYFDGEERELRGFGMVEQFDTEEFSALGDVGDFPTGDNIDATSHVPPVLTRSWFHTGIYVGRGHVSDFYAGLLDENDVGEYYREPGLTDAQARALLLADTVLPAGLTAEEEREACRALKGSMLRQEVFALDGTEKEDHPFTVTEQNFTVQPVQTKAGNRHAVFFTHAQEAVSYHYERNPADPRITHTMNLEMDGFGNVLKSAAIGYGRRQPDLSLSPEDQAKQAKTHVTYTENRVTNAIEVDDDYRTPLPCESRTYELTGYTPSGAAGLFRIPDFVQTGPDDLTRIHIFDSEIDYEEKPTNGRQRRLIEQVRTLYRADDFGASQNDPLALLPLGEIQALALPGESYTLAFTPGLLTRVFQRPRPNEPPENLLPDPIAVLPADIAGGKVADRGGYFDLDGDDHWWIPSGRVFLSPDPFDSAAVELTHARQHFFLPHRNRDPFGASATATVDAHDLLMVETRDALGNRVSVGERDTAGNLTAPGNDYRVLQPRLVTGPNGNRSEVAFDALGMVAGTAVMGKKDENKGDLIDETFLPDLDNAAFLAHIEDPLSNPHDILQKASTRLVYDLFAYQRTSDALQPEPAVVYTLARETHHFDLVANQVTKVQHSFSYSDGFGREIQTKIQAEPGPVPKRDTQGEIIVGPDGQPEVTANDVSPRWVGSGWTVFNNKGKTVRQYEPFFTDRHRFEFDVRIGVSPVLFYDPVERVVATLHPNHTWEKVVFDPWRQESWDVNDTVLVADPESDHDVGDFFRRLQDANYLPTWHVHRQSGALGTQEQQAADKTAIHAETPSVTHSDSLGRPFLTVAHNKFKYSNMPAADPPTEEFHRTRVVFDIEGNQREVIDANDRIVMRYIYDMLGNPIHHASMEAGERWMLNDITGQPIRAWDSRDHEFRAAYDVLRRPAETFLRVGTGSDSLVGRTVYGETRPDPETKNLRGQVVQLFDQACEMTSDEYDFKGNLLHSQRQLALEYKTTLDWLNDVPLEDDKYASQTHYDALNRPTEVTAPDNSVINPAYNEANLLDSVSANLKGADTATKFVNNIDYDAKGHRERIEYSVRDNAGTLKVVHTEYDYDPDTFRLIHLKTTRSSDGKELQNLSYTYDPAGNFTHIRDDAQQSIFFDNKRVEPSNDYIYDAIYRLIEAAGREHLGQTGGQTNAPKTPDAFNAFHTRLDHPGNGNAMGTYVERYVYDAMGNIMEMQHRSKDPAHDGWVRDYEYNETSLIEPARESNRLSRTRVGNGDLETYTYDVHGNITSMPHLPLMQWDYLDQLQATAQQVVNTGGAPEITYYVYDAGGQRVRKVTERQAAAGQIPTRMKERIYFGGFEIFREYENDGETMALERETLHITDDQQRIALVETRTRGSDPAPEQLIRHQLTNHLGSASLELDDEAQIISYEEYFPYGSTSYQAVRSQTDTPKRYRFTGKERDEESGLSYHWARYYLPWLGRWGSVDPKKGKFPQLSPFCYALLNPVRFVDQDGKEPKSAELIRDVQLYEQKVRNVQRDIYRLTSNFTELINKFPSDELNLKAAVNSPEILGKISGQLSHFRSEAEQLLINAKSQFEGNGSDVMMPGGVNGGPFREAPTVSAKEMVEELHGSLERSIKKARDVERNANRLGQLGRSDSVNIYNKSKLNASVEAGKDEPHVSEEFNSDLSDKGVIESSGWLLKGLKWLGIGTATLYAADKFLIKAGQVVMQGLKIAASGVRTGISALGTGTAVAASIATAVGAVTFAATEIVRTSRGEATLAEEATDYWTDLQNREVNKGYSFSGGMKYVAGEIAGGVSAFLASGQDDLWGLL